MKVKYLCHNGDPRIHNFTLFIQANYPQLITEPNPDLYFVAGGDGAMLHAIQEKIHEDVPFLGKAMGTFNFLMNDIEDDNLFVTKLLNDEIQLDEITSNAIEVLLDDVKIGEAVNEVLIGNNLTDYYTFNITTADQNFQDFGISGSGLCISTAIGSTAFNFNNNGQILPLDSSLLSMTGIVCNRHLNDIIPFQEIRIRANKAKIFLSNVEAGILDRNSELILRKGSPVKLLFTDKKDFTDKRKELSHRYRK